MLRQSNEWDKHVLSQKVCDRLVAFVVSQQEKIDRFEESCQNCNDAETIHNLTGHIEHLEGKVLSLENALDDANEILNQKYIDENQTVWTIPTPEAYAIVCKRMHALKTSNELLRIRLRDYKHWISKHRTDKRLKWIDAKETIPKEDVITVLLMDNGRIDIGYKSRKGYYVSHGFMIVNEVTHWMPIPDLPEETITNRCYTNTDITQHKIEKCLDCPNIRLIESNRYACQNGKIYTEIEDAEKIPRWCQLPRGENPFLP